MPCVSRRASGDARLVVLPAFVTLVCAVGALPLLAPVLAPAHAQTEPAPPAVAPTTDAAAAPTTPVPTEPNLANPVVPNAPNPEPNDATSATFGDTPAAPTGGTVPPPIGVTPPPIGSVSAPGVVAVPAPNPNTTQQNRAQAGASPQNAALPARGTLEISGGASSLSVFAVGVDAPELLTAIASRAGLKLVVDDSLSRRITIAVRDRSAREVVSLIADAYGLAAADVNGITIVSEGIPRTPSSYLLSEIDQISTKYVDASGARNLLPVFLQDYVKVNSEQNAVVLSAPREVLDKFREDVAGFDIPAAQIVVDLLLVELTDTDIDQLSLNLNYANAGAGINFNPGAGTISYRSVTTLTDQFFVQLSALREKGRARVRANPRVATVSGRRASIFVGRQRYVVTPIDTGGGQRNFIDAGVRLEITPYTGGQGQILIDLDTEVSTLSALDPLTRLPEKSTRTASTKVRVGSGQTIVIGGLRQQETRRVRTRVPILGNLPLIGGLFRSRDNRSTDSELVLFITPRLLTATGHLPAEEEAQLKNRFLAPDLSAPLPPPSFDVPDVPSPFEEGDSDLDVAPGVGAGGVLGTEPLLQNDAADDQSNGESEASNQGGVRLRRR